MTRLSRAVDNGVFLSWGNQRSPEHIKGGAVYAIKNGIVVGIGILVY